MRPSKIIALLVIATTTLACAADPVDDNDSTEKPVEVETDTTTPSYGSGYASNCYCILCTKYCTVNGTTYKNGTCC